MNPRIDVLAMLTALASGAILSACGDDGGHLLDAGNPDATIVDGGPPTDGGATDGGEVCDVTPTFTSIYAKIFSASVTPFPTCALSGCHAPVTSAMLDMSGSKDMAYAALVGADTFCQSPCQPDAKAMFPKRVVAGSADTSFLYEKISKNSPAGGKGGTRMPQGGALTSCEIDAIKQWINDGAMNN
jgi:hypothetical protein